MAARKPIQKKSQTVKAQTQPAKTAKAVEPQKTSSGWMDYFRFGESYTSLILGIIVVIITTILLVFTVKDRSSLPVNNSNANLTKDVSSTRIEPTMGADATIGQLIATGTPIPTVPPTDVPTAAPTVTKAVVQPTKAVVTPTVKVQATVKPSVTVAPTQVKPTTRPTVVAQKPTQMAQPTQPQNIGGQKSYTVAAGDTLWSIAEKFYKSGYNWVDIANANKVSNPGMISAGTKLVIPDVAPKVATVTSGDTTAFGPKITGSTYTIQKGDNLWGIAVRAYGDGYKWTEIAKFNNITSPSLINEGTVLKLPRINDSPVK